MKNIIKTILATTALVSSLSFAQGLTFKGLTLQAPLPDKDAAAEVLCGKVNRGILGTGKIGVIRPSEKDANNLICTGNTNYAGYDFSSEAGMSKDNYTFLGVVLKRSFGQGVMDPEPHAGANDLENKMIQAYGQPTFTKETTLQNGFGAKRTFNSWVVWEKGDTMIVKADDFFSLGRSYSRDVVIMIGPTDQMKAILAKMNVQNKQAAVKDIL